MNPSPCSLLCIPHRSIAEGAICNVRKMLHVAGSTALPGAVLCSNPDADLSLTSWDIAKGYAYRKLGGRPHMHPFNIISVYYDWKPDKL